VTPIPASAVMTVTSVKSCACSAAPIGPVIRSVPVGPPAPKRMYRTPLGLSARLRTCSSRLGSATQNKLTLIANALSKLRGGTASAASEHCWTLSRLALSDPLGRDTRTVDGQQSPGGEPLADERGGHARPTADL